MAAYPTELPIFELRAVLATINSGDIMGQKAEFFKNLWWVQGYGQKLMLGEQTQMVSASAAPFGLPPGAPEIASNQDAAGVIQKIIDNSDGASAQAMSELWAALVSWAISKALELLLK
jgi:hypothetical protein